MTCGRCGGFMYQEPDGGCCINCGCQVIEVPAEILTEYRERLGKDHMGRGPVGYMGGKEPLAKRDAEYRRRYDKRRRVRR